MRCYYVVSGDERILYVAFASFDGRLHTSDSFAFGAEGGIGEKLMSVRSIEGLDVLDASKTKSFRGMYYGLSGLECLDLSSFDTSNVTDMSDIAIFHLTAERYSALGECRRSKIHMGVDDNEKAMCLCGSVSAAPWY